MPSTPDVISLGVWTPAADEFVKDEKTGEMRGPFRHWQNADGEDWYATIAKVDGSGCQFVSVLDGMITMRSEALDGIVPDHGEVLQIPASLQVERGWLWKGDHAEAPPAPPPSDPVAKLKAFLSANPDVAAVLK